MVIDSHFSMTFNGVDLMQWIDGITNIERDVGQNRSSQLVKIGRANGEHFNYTTAAHGTITVTALIVAPANRRALSAALMIDEPEQLIFSDEPDKYYDAIVDGQATLAEAYQNNVLTITFTVPDGLAHAVEASSATGAPGDDITVTNGGTAPVAPVLTATVVNDDGLVAWTNDQGSVLQFGSPDELDGVQHDDSQMVFHYDFLSRPSGVVLNKGTITYTSYLGDTSKPNTQAGSFSYGKDAATPVLTRTASDYWAGPSMHGEFPANSLGDNKGNFIWSNRINFSTNGPEAGRVEFNLTSDTGVVMSLVLHDSNYQTDMLELDFVCDGQAAFSQNLDRRKFTNGFYNITMKRLGDQASFTFAKIQSLGKSGITTGASVSETYTFGGLSDLSVTGYTAWFAGFGNKPGWGINWSDSVFDWVNVDYWQDMPNRFKAGDVIMADVATKTVYVNGVEDPTLQTVGNEWDGFMLQPGVNRLQLVLSSWAEPATDGSTAQARVDYREAWL